MDRVICKAEWIENNILHKAGKILSWVYDGYNDCGCD